VVVGTAPTKECGWSANDHKRVPATYGRSATPGPVRALGAWHFDGTTWTHVTAPALNGAFFPDILALSGTDVWATASTASGRESLVHLSRGQTARLRQSARWPTAAPRS
jgi:hypothetical protein